MKKTLRSKKKKRVKDRQKKNIKPESFSEGGRKLKHMKETRKGTENLSGRGRRKKPMARIERRPPKKGKRRTVGGYKLTTSEEEGTATRLERGGFWLFFGGGFVSL